MKKIFFLLCLVACSPQAREDIFPPVNKRASQVIYVKDVRTNLCFVHNEVTMPNMASYDIFTNVPCTPEVETIISNGKN